MTGTDLRNFVPLMRVVKAAIIDAYEDMGKTQELFLHWASREYKKLNRQSLKMGKRYALLSVNANTHTATLPTDFSSELFVGILGSNGMKLPLPSNNNLVNINNIEVEDSSGRCSVCNSPKAICEDLQISDETNLIVINGTAYEQKINKKLYPNGDYYLETTTPYFDEISSSIVYHTQKQFIDHLSLKSCGCIEDTESNISVLKRCAFGTYCCYYAACDCNCAVDMGSYRIFEENGLIQLSHNFPFDKIYIEYRGSMPKIKGQLAVPEVAFETLVEGIKFRSIDGRKNISNPDKRWRWEMYTNARRNMDKELGRVSLSAIIEAAMRVPKFNISYQTDWCGYFDWNFQYKKAVNASSGTTVVDKVVSTTPTGNTSTETTVITNNNYYPDPTPPSIIVNGLQFNSEGTYANSKYAGYDLLIYFNSVRYLTRNEYSVLPTGGATIFLKDVFASDIDFIFIPNNLIS